MSGVKSAPWASRENHLFLKKTKKQENKKEKKAKKTMVLYGARRHGAKWWAEGSEGELGMKGVFDIGSNP